jgi:hypothetical protein
MNPVAKWERIVLALLIGCVFTAAQVVQVGADGKRGVPRATPEYCSQVEHIRPNLMLIGDTRVQGRVTDQTTAPFRKSPIELRRFISENDVMTVKKSTTDSEGRFDLGVVKQGKYRLLLSPHRGFKQPDKLECDSMDCKIDAVLIANPTDAPTANCPIR